MEEQAYPKDYSFISEGQVSKACQTTSLSFVVTWFHVSGVYHGDLDCEDTLRVTINVCSLCTEGLHPSHECSWKRQQVQ